jgi:osmotically-inducible protein OsmY
MGWLTRLFGGETATGTPQAPSGGGGTATAAVPAERMGLNGEFDQSGLAKRVARAFDQDAAVKDIDTVWVAQTGGTVVLKGKVPSQETLQKLVSIARTVNGATGVETDQVTIG